MPFDPDQYLKGTTKPTTPAPAPAKAAPAPVTAPPPPAGKKPFDPDLYLAAPPQRFKAEEPHNYLEDAELLARGMTRGVGQDVMAIPNIASREIHQITGTKPGPEGFMNRYANADVGPLEEAGRVIGGALPFAWLPETYLGRATLGGLANLATRAAPAAIAGAGFKFPEYWHWLAPAVGLHPLAQKAAPYVGRAAGSAGPFAEKLGTSATVRYLGRPEDASDADKKD